MFLALGVVIAQAAVAVGTARAFATLATPVLPVSLLVRVVFSTRVRVTASVSKEQKMGPARASVIRQMVTGERRTAANVTLVDQPPPSQAQDALCCVPPPAGSFAVGRAPVTQSRESACASMVTAVTCVRSAEPIATRVSPLDGTGLDVSRSVLAGNSILATDTVPAATARTVMGVAHASPASTPTAP